MVGVTLWGNGYARDLVMRKAEERWGSGIVEQVSLDLQREFPGDGFSASNVWFMKRWYLFYLGKLHQLGAEVARLKLDQLGQEMSDITTEGLSFPLAFSFVPWRHHVEIIKKCKDLDEALYYIRRTIEGAWSRNYLIDRIKAGEYQKQGHALNNFPDILPLPHAQLAEELTKENYDLGFVTLPPSATSTARADRCTSARATWRWWTGAHHGSVSSDRTS